MPYVLSVAAAAIFVVGLTRLGASGRHRTPWGALLLWAVLLGIGMSVWMMSAQLG
jgi:hypothetical protein